MGGIPVDRNKNTNLVSQLQQYFNQSDELMLIITPEGTRSYVKHWKRGFYFIAQKAGVPVIPTYLDYEKKVGAMLPPYYLTDDIESDFKYLTSLFADKTGRHPEKYNPSPRLKS
jgi:1-acyl-sn-glycerol-3-phosphate acyltransferase